MSNHCHDRFKTWISQTVGGAALGEVVVAELYDAAQSELSALREELATVVLNLKFAEQGSLSFAEEADQLQQRLTDAERRNVELVELLRMAWGVEHVSAEDSRRIVAVLKPTESGVSE